MNNFDISGLLSEYSWPTNSISYSFPLYAEDYQNYSSEAFVGFEPFSPEAQNSVRQIFSQIEEFTNLDFTELPRGEGDIRYGQSTFHLIGVAYAYYPFGNAPIAGDVWVRADYSNFSWDNLTDDLRALQGILHETGHALGLKHPHEEPFLNKDFDNGNYTVMSYNQRANGHLPETYMALDILALQTIYGANYNHNSGDNVYVVEKSVSAIWDGGGNDTLDFSNLKEPMTISLEPGGLSHNKNEKIVLGNSFLFNGDERSMIENAIGTKKADKIYGNHLDNILEGGKGKDKLYGGSGSDTFVFNKKSLGNKNKDKIKGYEPGIDIIKIDGLKESHIEYSGKKLMYETDSGMKMIAKFDSKIDHHDLIWDN